MKKKSMADEMFLLLEEGISSLIVRDEKYREASSSYSKAYEEYIEGFSQEQIEALEKYDLARTMVNFEAKRVAFTAGLKLGLRLMEESNEAELDEMFDC